MVKKLLFGLCCLFCADLYAADDLCNQYKKIPDVNVLRENGGVKIQSSNDDLWPKGGYVNVMPFGSFAPKISYVFNGKYYCVFLDSVDAKIGFKDFEVVIDKKYKKDSCEYNAILEHENHHIADSRKALDSVFQDVDVALHNISNDIMPIYVENVDNVPIAFETIQNKIVDDVRLKNLVEKFKKQQENDASILDGTEDEKIKKCIENKVNDAFERYFKSKKK
ncbi:MAG: hypothetical protein IKP24_03635 [Alphaproteobacteria bacterium]|nr:hypothetical protein [Alphaproteobacteria bacterium]